MGLPVVVYDGIARTVCKARAKSTGQRCTKKAIEGATVCRVHGGAAPQVRAAAAKRIGLAQAFVSGDRRPAWEILADALHAADTLMLDARVKLTQDGEPVTVEALDKFLSALDRAQKFAKTVLDAGVEERRTQAAEALTGQLVGYVRRAMASLELAPAVRGSIERAIAAEIRRGPG